jgi:UDP-N-acetyl-D-glucosamine dehydrogenase
MPHIETFLAKLATTETRLAIIGLGYVGLPLARTFVEKGFPVLGYDTDSRKVGQLQGGESYVGHVPAAVIRAMRDRNFEASNCCERLGEADAILICVPTPLTEAREPDLSNITAATRSVAAVLRPGQLVVLESTTYPGTTRQVVRPILEEKGLHCGQDFFLAYSPEREDPGNAGFATGQIPKVIGGADPISLHLAASLYGEVMDRVVPVSSCEAAEACKILENTYRCVNIALVNELKVLYDRMGIDVWEVIEAAKTKPFGFQPFYPGPGLGGHCIPIDPFYLAWLARKYGLTTRFIELAGEINTAMPAYVASRVADALNDRGKPVRGSKILILGVAYKKDVDDARESPGLALLHMLARKGAEVEYNDPHIPALDARCRSHFMSRPLTEELLRAQDCVLIVTDHSAYDWAWIVRHSPLVVDTRNATRDVHISRHKIVAA